MELKAILADSLIIKDGVPLRVDFSALEIDTSNLWALEWDDSVSPQGEMELLNGNQNVPFTDQATVQPFIDLYDNTMAEESVVDLDLHKAAAIDAMSTAARAQIIAGFESDALGTTHHYGGFETDQINLIGAATSGADMPYPCRDQAGVWARRLHTAAQLNQVLRDGSLFKQSVLVALDGRRNEIDLAVDEAQVDAVQWMEVTQ